MPSSQQYVFLNKFGAESVVLQLVNDNPNDANLKLALLGDGDIMTRVELAQISTGGDVVGILTRGNIS